MSKAKIILFFAFLLTLAAGASVGLVGSRTLPPRGDRHSWLTEELDLTAEQEQQMKEIWSNVMRGGREHGEKHRAIQKERDDAIVALLSPEQKEQYEQLQGDYRTKLEEMSQERERAFAGAIEATKKILSPEQQKKYEELMSRRRPERGDRAGRGPGSGREMPPGPPPGFDGPPPTREGPPDRLPPDARPK